MTREPTKYGADQIKQLVAERQRVVVEIRANSANPANHPSNSGVSVEANNAWIQGTHTDWPQPLRFNERTPSVPYPIESLPKQIRDAVNNVADTTQAPHALIASSAICTLATACQGVIDVARAPQLVGPVSLFYLVLGDSGERKSTVDAQFNQPLKDFQKEALKESQPEIARHKAELEVWDAKLEQLKASLRKRSHPKSEADAEATKKALERLHQEKPKPPLIPKLTLTDITTEKLHSHLANEWPSCLIATAEGGLVFGGRSLSRDYQTATLGTFNALWSGESIDVARKTVDSFEIRDARLSLSLLVQPSVFISYMAKNQSLRQIGFLARCLFAFPESTQGSRLYREPDSVKPGLDAFHQLVLNLLQHGQDRQKRGQCRTTLYLSASAKDEWISFHNEIETNLGRNGAYADVRDFGSKAAENAARLAAIFQHATDPNSTQIEADSMKSACTIAGWHLQEARRFFASIPNSPDDESIRAKHLSEWLISYCVKHGTHNISRSTLMQCGPNKTRKRNNLLESLKILEEYGHIRHIGDKRSIEINPALLGNSP